MAVELGVKPVTAEDFEQFDPDWRYDLIEGELVRMPPLPGDEHGAVTYDFGWEIGRYVREHGLGRCWASETRFVVERDPDTVLAPDLAFVRSERLPQRRGQGFVETVPDLVVEVRSPSDRPQQVAAKVARWLRVGVQLVWELDLQTRTLTAHGAGREPRRVGLGGEVDGDDVLPGFRMPLRVLFPGE